MTEHFCQIINDTALRINFLQLKKNICARLFYKDFFCTFAARKPIIIFWLEKVKKIKNSRRMGEDASHN